MEDSRRDERSASAQQQVVFETETKSEAKAVAQNTRTHGQWPLSLSAQLSVRSLGGRSPALAHSLTGNKKIKVSVRNLKRRSGQNKSKAAPALSRSLQVIVNEAAF